MTIIKYGFPGIPEFARTEKIKIAGLSDIDKISSVHMKAWKKAYSKIFPSSVIENQNLKVFTTKWHTWLKNKSMVNYIMQTENIFSGFISFGPDEIEGVCGDWEIYSIYIDPKYWGQGVGKKLMTVCFRYLKDNQIPKIKLWVVRENLNAQIFYEKLGFKKSSEYRKKDQYEISFIQDLFIKGL